MDLLVIGGSRFVGKHFVQAALARGHRLTLFNRGTRPAPEGVRLLRGDRNEDLGALREGRWDAVLDTCAYHPRQVRTALEALEGRAERYALISTISVYADATVPHQDEDAPVVELEAPVPEEVTNETYGGLKVACERELGRWAGASTIVRPGLIVGPDDPTDRFTYWPVRVARGGEVLAPHGPDVPVQWIDVRDLAAWLVTLLENGTDGVFHAVCEADRFGLGDVIDASREVSGSDARPTWVDDAFLVDEGVGAFVELPLWIPGEEANLMRLDASRAHAAGLRARDVVETVRDTLAWHRDQERDPLAAGLAPERERELLAAWHARARNGGRADASLAGEPEASGAE